MAWASCAVQAAERSLQVPGATRRCAAPGVWGSGGNGTTPAVEPEAREQIPAPQEEGLTIVVRCAMLEVVGLTTGGLPLAWGGESPYSVSPYPSRDGAVNSRQSMGSRHCRVEYA